jgi:RNA-directed DNA polymerase
MPVNADTANDMRRDRGTDPVRDLQRKLYRAAKQSRSRRFHALFDKVHRRDVLGRAWEEVRGNGGAPGGDGVSIEAIAESGVEQFLDGLASELREGRYRPQPVWRVTIPKPAGGVRHLGVPAVRDRVVQTAVKIVCEPIFEADFAPVSFGFRPRRSALGARERVRDGMGRGFRVVVDADIAGFFDQLEHRRLLHLVRQRISDRRVVELIAGWLRSGVLTDGGLLHPEAGTPQGGVISPLLANIYLNQLDHRWQMEGRRLGELTRYADDLVVVCPNPDRAEAAMALLRDLLAELGLEPAEAKTRIVDGRTGTEGFDFLGYHFRMKPKRHNRQVLFAACWPSKKAVAAAKERIRQLTPLDRLGLPPIVVVEDLNRFLCGWGAYFRHGNSTQQFKAIDEYVTERVARFIARKHQTRNWRYGLWRLLSSHTQLGLVRLVGTVNYPTAHATR